MITANRLDAEEYLHLALHAGAAGQHHACMTYLKEALELQPKNPKAIYLLAVQHAELGLIERAIAGMEAALAIEPALEIAHFQLGLLLLDRRRTRAAAEHFSALAGSADVALRAYAEAMLALGRDDVRAARDKLASGLSAQSDNQALTALMRRLLERLSAGEHDPVSKPAAPSTQIPLGAYRDTSS